MKKVFRNLNAFLEKHQNRWYFLPAFGLIFLILTISSIMAYRLSSRPTPNDSKKNEVSQTTTPTPTPTPNNGPGFGDIIEEKDDFDEIGNPPSPTPTPKPTPTPIPSPTPFSKEEIYIALPENNKVYDNNDIKFSVEAKINQPVTKLELILNGVVKQSFENTKIINTTINLESGIYMVVVKAYLKDGSNLESTTFRFSSGGRSLTEPSPSPTPTSTQSAVLKSSEG